MATLTPFDLSLAIVACALTNVRNEEPFLIARSGVVPGDIAWDECECGQLVIAEVRRFPSMNFPLEEVDHTAECGEPWLVVEYTLSLTRCAPGPDKNGRAPTMAALQAAAEQLSADMTTIRAAVYCCLQMMYDTEPANGDSVAGFELGQQTVVGPQGSCVGSELTIWAGFLQGCGCG